MRTRQIVVASAALLANVAAALAVPPPTAIFSTNFSNTNSELPGVPGVRIGLSDGSNGAFERSFGSLSNGYWILRTDISDGEQAIITGQGPTNVGARTIARYVGTLPGLPGFTLDDTGFQTPMGINSSGNISLSVDLIDGTNPNDLAVLRYDRGTGLFSFFIREGDPVPGFPGETIGATLNNHGITDDGDIAYRAWSTNGPLPPDEDEVFFIGDTLIAQSAVTIPNNQLGGAMSPIGTTNSMLGVSAAGVPSFSFDMLNEPSTSDAAISIGLDIVLQESQAFAGSTLSGSSTEQVFTPNGDLLVQWRLADFRYTISLNGELYLIAGDPLIPGEPELWIETGSFNFMNADEDGIVIGGTSDTIDPNRNGVLVYYPKTARAPFVAAREGDPVDFNGDGLLNDDRFLRSFDNYDGFLADGYLYFTAIVGNGAGAASGHGFFVVPVGPAICVGDMNCDGVVNFGDIDPFVLALQGQAAYDAQYPDCEWLGGDTNGDQTVNFGDIDPFVALIGGTSCP